MHCRKNIPEKTDNIIRRSLRASLPSGSDICMENASNFAESDNASAVVYSKADVHIHSSYSDGTSSPEDIVDATAGKLQVIAVTDHNRIKGAFKAKEYALRNNLKIDVIIGEEISTKNGHVVGLFLNSKIIPGKDARDAIYEIHKQGGIAVAAHPFNFVPFNEKGYPPIKQLLHELAFDAIEVVSNSHTFSIASNAMASLANASLGLAQLGVSDAHTKEFIGKGYTMFAGTSANDFRVQLMHRNTTAHFDSYSISEMTYDAFNKLRSLYLYISNKNPNE